MVKLGSLKSGRDGKLVIVSRDNSRFVESNSAPTLQSALDNWDKELPLLTKQYEALNADEKAGQAVDVSKFHSPLPRAYEWIDGSAFLQHVRLVRKARNADPPKTLTTDPLVYQGGSGTFLAPTQDIEHFSEDYGIDYEAELAVITGDTPMGTKAPQAKNFIKLVTLLNDVTLRNLIPTELGKSFGFFVSKPSTAFAPFAVTPDELGDAWKDGRLHLDVHSRINGKFSGNPNAGPEMHFGFNELLQHVTQTRNLTAGTIIGSGTISNVDTKRGSSCLSEKRMLEKINTGKVTIPYLKFGDQVEIEVLNDKKQSIFGLIKQTVAQKKQ